MVYEVTFKNGFKTLFSTSGVHGWCREHNVALGSNFKERLDAINLYLQSRNDNRVAVDWTMEEGK